MALTEQQKTTFLEECDGEKVKLYCAEHMYFGPMKGKTAKPTKNCQKCWMIFYFHDIVSAPPHQRAERLDELTEVLNHAVELAQSGKWDITINPHADIKIESE